MKKIALLLTICLSLNAMAQQPAQFPTTLMITPEKSNFEKTSSHADVMQFLNTIKTMSSLIHVGSIGKSTMGKEIPYAVLANPAITNPEQAKQSGKPVV